MKVLVLACVALMCLSSCKTSNSSAQTGGKEDLGSVLLQAAVGSLDPSASSRAKLKDPACRRRVNWDAGIAALHASSLRVCFDSDQRAASWRANLTSEVPLSRYAPASTLEKLGLWQGLEVSRFKTGPLEGALVTRQGSQLVFYSYAYAVRYQNDLSTWAAKRGG